MCVLNHQLRDTAHQSSAYTAQAPAAQDDEACSQLFGYLDDRVGSATFGYPQLLLSNFPSGLLDLL
jgi:hypothetical protein